LLGVILFIAFWVVLAAGVFFFAGRRPDGARQRRSLTYRGSRTLGLGLTVLYVAFGVVIPVLFLHGNNSHANAQVGGNRLTAAEKRGREIFAFRCGFCHTLAAANAVGKVGPNLDQIKPSYSLAFNTIEHGCLPNGSPSSGQACLGQGVMPAAIIQGQEATEVAQFVAKVAGRE
jgi:mono/diheme cytochrome c family protein